MAVNLKLLSYEELKKAIPANVLSMILNIIKVEGGFVDDPRDSGGATKYGITEKVARARGYKGRMEDLPEEFAFRTYLEDYYIGPKFDQVAERDMAMAEELTDTGVNMGQGRAAGYLQQALLACNSGLAADIPVTNVIGTSTLALLDKVIAKHGKANLTNMLNSLQGDGYISIAAKTPKNRAFTFGWLSHRVALSKPVSCPTAPVTIGTFTNVAAIHKGVAMELTDIEQQFSNPKLAAAYLQRSLNALNMSRKGKPLYNPLGEDGVAGRFTCDALVTYLGHRGGKAGAAELIKALNCMQGATILREAILLPSKRSSTDALFSERVHSACWN